MGVTAFDGAEAPDQPAPLSALTVKVYAVPFVSPETVQESAEVRHIRPPGEELTWYVDTGKEPADSGAAQETAAEPSSGAAVTTVGAEGA